MQNMEIGVDSTDKSCRWCSTGANRAIIIASISELDIIFVERALRDLLVRTSEIVKQRRKKVRPVKKRQSEEIENVERERQGR